MMSVDLGHNHILDSGLEGVYSTAKAFEDAGITPVGVYTHEREARPPLVIKKWNGIKIAILAYATVLMEWKRRLFQKSKQMSCLDLDEERMKAEIKRQSKRLISPLSRPRWESSTSWSRQKSKRALS